MVTEQNKSSEFQYPVHDLIRQRRSRRSYSSQPIEEVKIKSLFEAARWAPSSMNEQPWAYIYATNDQASLWEKIFDTLSEGNKIWAKDAPLLIVSLARKNFIRNDHPNYNARYDMGAANALLSVQATSFGLNVHQMGGFEGEALMTNLNVPADYEPGVILAVGYPGDASQLPENLQLRENAPRYRWVQDEFVMNAPFNKRA